MSYIYDSILSSIKQSDTVKLHGRITEVIGLLIESTGPAASIGDVCIIKDKDKTVGKAEVVGFKQDRTLLMPLGQMEGIHPGNIVVSTKEPLNLEIGQNMLGRVLDGLGRPIDGKGALLPEEIRPVFSDVPNPLTRKRVIEPMHTGIRSIDGLLTIGKGQRMGIFAGSGVGKSVLMGMMAKNCGSDINVIVLVGERGREVREFLERDLGNEGLKRSVVIVATSDQPALIRIKATEVAASIAEFFRDRGNDVFFMCDSLTRLALAQREVGLAVGEPPATKGFTPSVFSILPKFLERASNSDKGTITGIFTVLVEGDDLDEPVSDAARGILDGHIVLSRSLAQKNHYPAVDVLSSISRCQNDITDEDHKAAVSELKNLMAAYRDNEDLISIGAYAPGTNADVDRAIKINEPIKSFLKQEVNEHTTFDEVVAKLSAIKDLAGSK